MTGATSPLRSGHPAQSRRALKGMSTTQSVSSVLAWVWKLQGTSNYGQTIVDMRSVLHPLDPSLTDHELFVATAVAFTTPPKRSWPGTTTCPTPSPPVRRSNGQECGSELNS